MLEHFNKHEHQFVLKVSDWVNQVYYSHKIKTTKFLTLREQEIVQMLVNQNSEVRVRFEGGFQKAERKRAILYPDYLKLNNLSQYVKGYEIEYNQKLVTLKHPQILGSLTALNIDRSLIGDIVILSNGRIYLAICEEFSEFFLQHFHKVGKHSILIKESSISQFEKIDQEDEFEIIISSMRLDVIVASLMKVSRSQVHEYIMQAGVQVNWVIEQNHSRICQIGDVLSIKRHGRFRLKVLKSRTKSERFVIIVGKTV